jgi:hypothetical protein
MINKAQLIQKYSATLFALGIVAAICIAIGIFLYDSIEHFLLFMFFNEVCVAFARVG